MLFRSALIAITKSVISVKIDKIAKHKIIAIRLRIIVSQLATDTYKASSVSNLKSEFKVFPLVVPT